MPALTESFFVCRLRAALLLPLSDLDFGVEESFVPSHPVWSEGPSSSSAAAAAASSSSSAPVVRPPRMDSQGHTIVSSAQLSIDILPERFRIIFPYPRFNRVQTTCFPTVFNTDENVIVSAPTGQESASNKQAESRSSLLHGSLTLALCASAVCHL